MTTKPERGAYNSVAETLDMSPEAVGVAVHRLRKRYRHYIQLEVANTVADVGDVQEELNHLLAALRIH